MKVDIYYKPTCPWCNKALNILEHQSITYRAFDISENPKLRKEMISRMENPSGHITVPQIFINWGHEDGYDDIDLEAAGPDQRFGAYIEIGGYDQLYEMFKNNLL